MSRVHLFSLSFTAFIKPDNGIFFSHCMLKLPALATESSNSFSCQSIFMYHYICHSYVTAWPESCITGRKQSVLLGVCKGKLWKVSGEEKDFISASYFKNSRKPPRCQPIPPCFYEEQDKHLQSRVILFLIVSKSPGPLQGCCWCHEHNMRLH